ncbi:MAG TPA: hypothetical protein VE646_13670 [Actinomycetota bacterium]|nr:hypothetical protein [Actinomycetota bacterium]
MMKGTRPGHLPAPSKTWDEEGRVCRVPGCGTRLSMYNAGETCWQHATITFPNFRGKRLVDPRA